jgi:hypothetical protein
MNNELSTIELKQRMRQGGLTQGKRNKESGHWAKVRALGPKTGAGNRHTIGQDNVHTGHIQALGLQNVEDGTLEFARHYRHHVLRDRVKNSKYCKFCDGVIAYA